MSRPHATVHPYLRFRARMAKHALLKFAASLQSSLEIILLGFAPVLLGLFACIALPGLVAASLPWPQALALGAAQTLLAAAPVFLLRKRLHPAEVLLWSRPLPIAAALRWRADAMVAGMIVGPLALAYAASTAIWLYQWPDWLQATAPQALLLTAATLLLGWLLATVVLARRSGLSAARRPRRRAPLITAYLPAPRPAMGWLGSLRFWRQLFWLPFWRAENMTGIQQSVLLAGAAASSTAWLLHPPLVPPGLWGASASLFLMVLTDRGDKAVTEQIALLQAVTADWPLRTAPLFRFAMLSSLLPALCVMLLFAALTLGRADAAGAGYSSKVATVWLCFAGLAQLAIVGLRSLSVRGRVGLVIGATIILSAIGSELWN